MRVRVMLENKDVVIDEVDIKPQVGDQVDPVEDGFEEFNLIGSHEETYAELESEPGDADIFYIVKDCRYAFSCCE